MIPRFPKQQKEPSNIFTHRIRNQELDGFLSLVVDARLWTSKPALAN